MNYGLKFDIYEDDHRLLGSGELGTEEINPNGDWSGFLPIIEEQAKNNIDTQACTRYGMLHCVTTLIKFLYKEDVNYSERFLSCVAGGSRNGDTPKNVAEAIKKYGCIDEQDLPFDDSIDTLDKYYSLGSNPQKLLEKGKKWLETFDFNYEWVYPPNSNHSIEYQNSMIREALKRSPVGISVSAWSMDSNGGYIQTFDENHWVEGIIFKEDEKYWYIFDSYKPFIKKYSKDSRITMAMLFKINKKTPKDISLWNKIINLIYNIVMPKSTVVIPVSNTATETVTPTKLSIAMFCMQIQKFEDYVLPGGKGRDGRVYPKGSISFQNANPGNLKAIGWSKQIGKDNQGHAVFACYKDGWDTLNTMVENACSGKSKVYNSNDTISQFFSKYCEKNQVEYAKFVAQNLGVGTDLQIKNLIIK